MDGNDRIAFSVDLPALGDAAGAAHETDPAGIGRRPAGGRMQQ